MIHEDKDEDAIRDMNTQWLLLLEDIMDRGKPVRPRGQLTYELINDGIAVDMSRPILTIASRELGYRFLCAEAAWILSGDDRVETIAPYSKIISSFSNDGRTFFGAYGVKLLDQLEYVVAALRADPTTRQAVANIWRENPPPDRKDIPCTLSCQFLIREGCVNAVVTMRSSDVWLGVPYDVFNFAMWTGYVMLRLGDRSLNLGYLYQTAASRHLYDRDRDKALCVIESPADRFEYKAFDPWEFENPGALVDHLWKRARREPTTYNWLKELPI